MSEFFGSTETEREKRMVEKGKGKKKKLHLITISDSTFHKFSKAHIFTLGLKSSSSTGRREKKL